MYRAAAHTRMARPQSRLGIHTAKHEEELYLLKRHLLHDSVALCALAILSTLHSQYEGETKGGFCQHHSPWE